MTQLSGNNPRILILDIETAPVLGSVWGLWQQNLGLAQIKEDWFVLSFCAKWLGDKRIIYHDQSKAANLEDDTLLMAKLHKLLDEADFVVAHNGKKFDIKKVNARMITKGFAPYSPVVVIDTLLEVRKVAAFTSNKLEWLTDQLCETKKQKHEEFPGFELWKQCLLGNPKAWRAMRAYNIVDVTSLEELYLKLRPWMEGHPNVATFVNPEEPACPKCAGAVAARGYRYTVSGKYIRYQCCVCRGWSRSRYTINDAEVRKNLLSN